MDLQPAPYHGDVAGEASEGLAYWVRTSDDLRIRIAHWNAARGTQGTVLLFPGRTEFIEKYAEAADMLAARGFATLCIDWRGQGLADRLLPERRLGHVGSFSDYQKDVAAALRAARELDLPRPWHLLGHSMGGCIGLRAITEGLGVQRCAFTGPMWGIRMNPGEKAMTALVTSVAPAMGQGTMLVPTTSLEHYVLTDPFENNTLTTDRTHWDLMRRQVLDHPDLMIGGPTVWWLREARSEMRHLAGRKSPDLPCLCLVGSNERIVDPAACDARMAVWPRGELVTIEGGEHELMMERADLREDVFNRIAALFSASGQTRSAVSG
jgi:lysophospholipase